jgi:predicted PurR-regulated permease PerM
MWFTVYDFSVWFWPVTVVILSVAFLYEVLNPLVARLRKAKELPELGLLPFKILGGVVIFALLLRFVAGFASAYVLRHEARALASAIREYAKEEQNLMPSPENPPDWKAYTKQVAQVSEETQQGYRQRFAPRVEKLRIEFLKRDIHDNDLNTFYLNPNNPAVVLSIGDRLDYLASQL